MSSFTKPLRVEHIDGVDFKLLDSFKYHVGSEDSDEVIEVHEGFTSDGATIPRILWPFVGHPMAEFAQDAFLHDFICRYLRDRYDRKRGEEIMFEAMGVSKVVDWKRNLIYRGLRVGGWYMYNKGAKDE